MYPLLAVLLLILCAHGDPVKPRSSTTTTTDQFNEFDWLLTKAVGANIKNNVVISPISVKLALAMLYEGADGTTAKQLEEVLRIEKGPGRSQRFSSILKSLQDSNSGYELDVGMKLFIDKEAVPKKSFEKKIYDLYNATIDSISFKNTTAAVAHINGWARSVTKGHIQHLLSEADAHHSTLMLLLNAVYFKGLWKYPFSLNDTKKGTFKTDQNGPVTVDYMYSVQTLSYFDSLDLKSSIVRLPYVGDKFAMYIILPDNGTTLDEVIANLTPQKMKSCISDMMQTTVQLTLPKYHYKFASSLAPVLHQLGITEIFSSKADLRNIAEGPRDPVVSNVIQKASIEVNELGTVATAATAVELVNKFGMHTVNFNVSRPFMFFIDDETTNTVIFVGKVVNPVALGKPIVSGSTPHSSTIKPESEVLTSSTAEPKPEAPSRPPVKPALPSNSSAPSNLEPVLLTSNGPVLAQRFPMKTEISSFNPFDYFDIQLLQFINKKEKNGNWVISSASIKAILGVLLEGASKLSAEELCLILRLPINVNEARKIMHRYQQHLQDVPEGIILKSGSSILVKQGIGINNKFRTNADNNLYAPVNVSNFNQPAVVTKEVNKWIKGITNGYISELITPDSIDSDAVMLLINAVYFKGDWKLEFDSKKTHMDCFYTPECTKVKMMETAGTFKFGEIRNLNARMIELPYKDPRYSMVIILPNEKTGLQRAAWDLSFNSFLSYLDEFPEMEIDLMMPLFSIDYSVKLKPILEDLGVSEIFSENADFSELFHSGTRAKVSEIVHRATIEVGEKGTIAAGASAAQFLLLSTGSKPKLYINRPFFFFVRDREAGFLFEGQVADVKSAQAQVRNYN